MSRSGATAGGYPLNLTGAVQPTRYVGGTTSGPPTSGTFAVGDFAVDAIGTVWVCTVAGAPGTWASATSSELAYAEITSNATLPTGTAADVAGLTVTFAPPTSQVMLKAFFPRITKDTTASYAWLQIHTSANFLVQEGVMSIPASGFATMTIETKVTGLTPGASVTYKVRGITGAGVTTLNAATFASGNGERPFLQARVA